MRKILLVLVISAMMALVAFSSSIAQTDVAHEIWNEMAETGKIDLSNCWELMGMYTFGETTGAGYVTLPMTADGQKISGAISWRIYPKSQSDITERYFPMLITLLENFWEENEKESIKSWLSEEEYTFVLARSVMMPYRTLKRTYTNFDIYINYDDDHNELYCLINATKDSPKFAVKQ